MRHRELGHSDRVFNSEDLAILNRAGRVVVMDHHDSLVGRMEKLVVEMPSMLDLSNRGDHHAGRVRRISKRVLHVLLHPSIHCRILTSCLAERRCSRTVYNTVCVGLVTQPAKVLILCWRIFTCPSCVVLDIQCLFERTRIGARSSLEFVWFVFFPWFG